MRRIRNYRHIILCIAVAWRLLMDLPHGQDLRDPGKKPGARVRGRKVLIWFPVLAALNGLLLIALGMVVEALSNRYVGAFAFALVTLAYLLIRHSGRGWVAMVSCLLNLCGGYGFPEALFTAHSDRTELDRARGRAVLIALCFVALLALFLMGLFGNMLFITAILAGAAAVQGEAMLAIPAGEGGLSDPKWIGRLIMWLIAIGFEAVWFFFYPVATSFIAMLMLFAICWIVGSHRGDASRFGKVTAMWTVSVTELVMLILGFLLTL